MRIATWNVNSVRARLPRVLSWLGKVRPDVVCLQETKCVDDDFPYEEIESLGYHVEAYGQKTYNGVAFLSRDTPSDVVHGLPDDGPDAEARAIAATFDDVRVLNLYVVNGKDVDNPAYAKKLLWMERVAAYVADAFPVSDKIVVTGDMNCTFDDRDVYDPVRWHEKILCSTPERAALAKIMSPGFTDAFRALHEEGGHYTWWDFRTRGFSRGQGLRIDHLLLSPPALEACAEVSIDVDERAADRPSDHAPVIGTFR